MTIKKDDLLRPTRNASHTLRVSFVYPCGKLASIYCPTMGSSSPRVISQYEGWSIERDGNHVGTV